MSGISCSRISPRPTRLPPSGRCRRPWSNARSSSDRWRACTPNGGTIRASVSPSELGRTSKRLKKICGLSPASGPLHQSVRRSHPVERRQLYDRLIEAAPRLRQRYLSHRNVTIAHGDAHVWNCLLPRDAESDDARFFDWDCWHIDVGTSDLAYMIAMHWYPDRRRRIRAALARPVSRGVVGARRRKL